MGMEWLWGRRRAETVVPPEWRPAPVSKAVPAEAADPSYEDFVLLRCRLPSEQWRALEIARRAAANDPEVRRRVLASIVDQLESLRGADAGPQRR